MIARARPQWALIAAFLMTIAHLVLTAKGVRVQVPVYWLVPLVYAITAFFQYDDPAIFKATCQLALSYAPVLMTSLFRTFVVYVSPSVYYSVHIAAFIAQATLRCLGLRGYWRRQERSLYSAAFSVTIAYTLAEVVFMLTLWFDGPHNAEPIRLSARVSSAALALQLLQLVFLAAIAVWPPPLRLIVREAHLSGGATSAIGAVEYAGDDPRRGAPGAVDGANLGPCGAAGPAGVAGDALAGRSTGAVYAQGSAANGVFIPGGNGGGAGNAFAPGGGPFAPDGAFPPGGSFAPDGNGGGAGGAFPPGSTGAYASDNGGTAYRVDARSILGDADELPELGDMPDLENPDDRIDEVALWRRMGRRVSDVHEDTGIDGGGSPGSGPGFGG